MERYIGSLAAQPAGLALSAALMLGALCNTKKQMGAGVLGLGGLYLAMKSYYDSLLDAAKAATHDAEGMLLYAEEKIRQLMKDAADALGLGSIFNPLIDGAFNAVRMAIRGASGLLDQLFEFLKSYGMYVLLAIVAYRYLR